MLRLKAEMIDFQILDDEILPRRDEEVSWHQKSAAHFPINSLVDLRKKHNGQDTRKESC